MHSFNAINIFVHDYSGQVATRNILFDSKPSLYTCTLRVCESSGDTNICTSLCLLYVGHDVRTARTNDGVVNWSLLEFLGVVGRNYLCMTVQLISSNACTTPNWIAAETEYVAASTSDSCVGVCASACTWNAVNNAFIVRASRPAQLGSRDFFSDDDDAQGKVQRFGMSTFYVDFTLMNSHSRILKKCEI